MFARFLRLFVSPSRQPDVYDRFAEELVPSGRTKGWAYMGVELRRFFGLGHNLPSHEDYHFFIMWGMAMGYCTITLSHTSFSVPEGEKDWFIPWSTRFHTRSAAVRAVARSLRMIGKELAEKDPDYQALMSVREAPQVKVNQ